MGTQKNSIRRFGRAPITYVKLKDKRISAILRSFYFIYLFLFFIFFIQINAECLFTRLSKKNLNYWPVNLVDSKRPSNPLKLSFLVQENFPTAVLNHTVIHMNVTMRSKNIFLTMHFFFVCYIHTVRNTYDASIWGLMHLLFVYFV